MHQIDGETDYWWKKKYEEQLMEELMVAVLCIGSTRCRKENDVLQLHLGEFSMGG